MYLTHFKIGNATKRLFLHLVIGLIAAFVVTSELQAQYQSTYIVAHRCNASNWAVNAVQKHGVNAIEADFRYGKKDWYLAHDHVLPTSVKLDTWLDAVSKEASRVGSPLALLHVDIKTLAAPLGDLFDRIREKLPTVYLLFDVGLVENGKYLAKIKDRILSDNRAAAAMGFDDSPTKVNQFFKKEGYPLNKYWYEIGVAAGLVWSKQEQDWTREAIRSRNAGTGPKVVIWTFEKESSVIYWLQEDVDAILVNSSKCFGRAGLATDADVHVRNAKACRRNEGGIIKGTCGKFDVGESCSIDADCKNNACARETAADNAPKTCCSSGKNSRYAGYDYCSEMPNGSTCWSDAMCASKTCKGNLSGLRKGTCK